MFNNSEFKYIGRTKNLKKRLMEHHLGNSPVTKKYKPFELIVYLSFKHEYSAIEFEKYKVHPFVKTNL